MNTNVKRRWISALRSGKYRQTKGVLRRVRSGQDRFCCLGVLCDISQKAEWDTRDDGLSRYGDSGGVELPTMKMLEWAGLTKAQAHDLAGMNDDGKRFSTIVDYIEREL